MLEADPGATLGMGTLELLDGESLRAASLDGRIEQLMDWKPVTAGDFFYIPAGTVHAIGAGIVLVEVQQNVDATYRLYDYGRPRELHLDDGVAVSVAAPYARAPVTIEGKGEKQSCLAGTRRPLRSGSSPWRTASCCSVPRGRKAGSFRSAAKA